MKSAIALLALAAFGKASVRQLDKRYTTTDNGITYNVHEHAATNSKLRYVKNSGICETTPGVNQYSGYVDVDADNHMFFWFFESRKDPKNAPLTLRLNGGPGCSSLIGLFQEHGPCTFNGGTTEPVNNPYSWNNVTNMLYVDQPTQAGFSYGGNGTTSSVKAAVVVWKLLQNFYAEFPTYKNRDFGLFTESYGGHYGPAFTHYFEEQNAAIDSGKIKGEKIHLVALGINNGLFDQLIQDKAYIDYGLNNKYKKLINESRAEAFYESYEKDCRPYLLKCNSLVGEDDACVTADDNCGNAILGPMIDDTVDFDYYDVRAPANDPFPPETYVSYLHRPEVVKAIGAQGNFTECGDSPIRSTGDGARSLLPDLKDVIKSGVNTIIWAGDADFICNYIGGYNAIQSIASCQFKREKLKPYTVNGKEYGLYMSVKNLNWLQVYEAGHEVPAYQPEVSLAVFKTIMSKKPLTPS